MAINGFGRFVNRQKVQLLLNSICEKTGQDAYDNAVEKMVEKLKLIEWGPKPP
eukprot:SAG11_NODE_5573_length_1520_cov_10.034483_3_plen_53_part_00